MFKESRIASTMIFFLFQVMMNKRLFPEEMHIYMYLNKIPRYTLNMLFTFVSRLFILRYSMLSILCNRIFIDFYVMKKLQK